MPRFKVTSPVRHDGKLYQPGDLVELSEEAARGLRRLEVIGDAEAQPARSSATKEPAPAKAQEASQAAAPAEASQPAASGKAAKEAKSKSPEKA